MAKGKILIKLEKIKFSIYLMIISILGFLAILVKSLTGTDISPYVEASLFMIIGFALMMSGSIRLFFRYFNNGLTATEVNRISSIVVGFAAFVVGFITAPFFGIEVEVLNGVKAIIALIAIVNIVIEGLAKK